MTTRPGPPALVGGAWFSWSPRVAVLDRPVTPRDLLKHDCRAFLAHMVSQGLTLPLLFAVFIGLFVAYGENIPRQVELGDLLLPSAQQLLAPLLLIGLAIGLPVLEDAHLLGVLRQIGGSYEFRHVELQQHLAGSP